MKYRNPDMLRCTDKYEVRGYVEEKGLGEYLIPLIGIYNNVEDIDFKSLPQQFVVKTTDGSGGNQVILCKDKNELKEDAFYERLNSWMSMPKTKNPGREWAYENGYNKDAPKGQCTIDRIDINGCYEPENCRWVNRHIQMNNKRNNRILTYNGESHTLAEWCEIVNIPYDCLKSRLNKLHWSVEKTLTTPTRNKIH